MTGIIHAKCNDKFRLENDTSKTAAGATLFQFQHSQWVCIGYHSKKLPQAVQIYRITELGITGLVCNINGFSQLLKHHYFVVLVDQKAIENLWKGEKQQQQIVFTALLLK